jgi:hypothetical protein
VLSGGISVEVSMQLGIHNLSRSCMWRSLQVEDQRYSHLGQERHGEANSSIRTFGMEMVPGVKIC